MTARLTVAFLAAVAAINGAHPFLHFLEGGALDSVLGYLNALACQVTNSVQPCQSKT